MQRPAVAIGPSALVPPGEGGASVESGLLRASQILNELVGDDSDLGKEFEAAASAVMSLIPLNALESSIQEPPEVLDSALRRVLPMAVNYRYTQPVRDIVDDPFFNVPDIPIAEGHGFGGPSNEQFPGMILDGVPGEYNEGIGVDWGGIFANVVQGISHFLPKGAEMHEELLDALDNAGVKPLDAVGISTFVVVFVESGAFMFMVFGGLAYGVGAELAGAGIGIFAALGELAGFAALGIAAAIITIIALIIALIAAAIARRKAKKKAEAKEEEGSGIWDPAGSSSNLPPGVLLLGDFPVAGLVDGGLFTQGPQSPFVNGPLVGSL